MIQYSLQFCLKLLDIAGRKMRIHKIGSYPYGDFSHIFALVCTQIYVIIHPTIKNNTEKQTLSLSIRKLI